MSAELFDTADYSPLFAGLPVAGRDDDKPAQAQPHYGQSALWCSACGGAGPFVRTVDDRSLCLDCARKLARKGK